jgi:hypothetical protein
MGLTIEQFDASVANYILYKKDVVNYLSTLGGVNGNFNATLPTRAMQTRGLWIPRGANFNSLNGPMLDYADELALLHKTTSALTFSTAISSANISAYPKDSYTPAAISDSNKFFPFMDDCSYIKVKYTAGTGATEADRTISFDSTFTTPIALDGSKTFHIGLTFRPYTLITALYSPNTDGGTADPLPGTITNLPVKIKYTFNGGTAVTIEPNMDLGTISWISPAITFNGYITSFKVELVFAENMSGCCRIQRIMLYHGGGRWNPWNVRRDGDTLYGDYTINGGLSVSSLTINGTPAFGGTISKTFTIMAPDVNDDFIFWKTEANVVITKLSLITDQGTVTGTIDTAGGVNVVASSTAVSTGSGYTSGTLSAAVTAGTWLKWNTTGVTGTPLWMAVAIEYNKS